MINLVKLIRDQQENDEQIVITDRHIVLDRTLHFYDEAIFRNCDFEIKPHNDSRFIVEEASVSFENCRFVGALAKPENGNNAHRAIISASEDSALSFTNCHFENADSFVSTEGEVNFHGCEVVYRGRASVGDGDYKPTYRNPYTASFLNTLSEMSSIMQENDFTAKYPSGALVCRFIRAESEEARLDSCTFDCEVNGDYSVMLSIEHGSLKNCMLKWVYEIEADKLEKCCIENCIKVSLQTEGGNNEATECRFLGCSEILATDADFTDCEFENIRDGFDSDNATVSRCVFRDMTPDDDGAIHIENTQMNDCAFENITLKNDYYLFSSDNDSSLNGCSFRKCRTTRDDLQLVNSGGYEGRIYRKWVEADICSGCTGLDKVIHMEEWEM